MKFTGERFMPEIPSDWGIEHFHRYLFARELCAEKDILDVASGEGYGSSILAEVAHHVTGVDISEEAVTFAQKNIYVAILIIVKEAQLIFHSMIKLLILLLVLKQLSIF